MAYGVDDDVPCSYQPGTEIGPADRVALPLIRREPGAAA
jgi:hypothetical protein